MKGAVNMSNVNNINLVTLDEHITKIANGDKSALAALYNCVSASVYSYALSVLKNRSDAEDVLQDTLLEVWNSAAKYQQMGKPMAWIITITRNFCLMNLRKKSRFSDEPLETSVYMPENEGLTNDDKIVIQSCIQTLGDDEREIVILHAVSGLKHREIAEILKLPLSTVLSKYNRSIKKLRKTLSSD